MYKLLVEVLHLKANVVYSKFSDCLSKVLVPLFSGKEWKDKLFLYCFECDLLCILGMVDITFRNAGIRMEIGNQANSCKSITFL